MFKTISRGKETPCIAVFDNCRYKQKCPHCTKEKGNIFCSLITGVDWPLMATLKKCWEDMTPVEKRAHSRREKYTKLSAAQR